MFITLKRIVSQTKKQINRTGWLAWASILVMSLAVFISVIFIALAYISSLFLSALENSPQIYVFFERGTEPQLIETYRDDILRLSQVESVEYTSESDAVQEYLLSSTGGTSLGDESTLPASLGVRLYSIEDADSVIDTLESEREASPFIKDIKYSREVINSIRSLFTWLRLGGGFVMGLLLLVIFTFTLLTVEFRTFNRSEELSIMQLVGGSLWFIRSPFIFEGAFYGFIGSLLSITTIYSLAYVAFVVNSDNGSVQFLVNFFAPLNWPSVGPVHYLGLFIFVVCMGTILGALNSYIAIRRYID